jgi:hypothetical protein
LRFLRTEDPQFQDPVDTFDLLEDLVGGRHCRIVSIEVE